MRPATVAELNAALEASMTIGIVLEELTPEVLALTVQHLGVLLQARSPAEISAKVERLLDEAPT